MPWDLLDNWALGYLYGDELRVLSQSARSKKQPEIPREMEIPVYEGEIGLRLSDVRGKSYYYRIIHERN